MASDGEGKMLFDLRGGRRKSVVKVVYATLAVLMGLSLFLVIGGFNISELFTSTGTTDIAGQYEDEAERLEAKLVQEPDNPALLMRLTKAQHNVANALYELSPEGERILTDEALAEFRVAGDTWLRYVDATKEPSPSLAQIMAPTLLILTQNPLSAREARENMEASVAAQRIAAEQRPNLNTLTTMALYTAVLGNEQEAERYANKAIKYANTKFEREDIGNKLEKALSIGAQFTAGVKQVEREEERAASPGSATEKIEQPLGELGSGGLGSPALGE